MNERLQELKYQAEELAYEEHKANCNKNGRDPSIPHANALNMTFEKFANLIIQECITNVKLWETDSRNHISYMLEQHFGVTK